MPAKIVVLADLIKQVEAKRVTRLYLHDLSPKDFALVLEIVTAETIRRLEEGQ